MTEWPRIEAGLTRSLDRLGKSSPHARAKAGFIGGTMLSQEVKFVLVFI
jgi:hypothetical protein